MSVRSSGIASVSVFASGMIPVFGTLPGAPAVSGYWSNRSTVSRCSFGRASMSGCWSESALEFGSLPGRRSKASWLDVAVSMPWCKLDTLTLSDCRSGIAPASGSLSDTTEASGYFVPGCWLVSAASWSWPWETSFSGWLPAAVSWVYWLGGLWFSGIMGPSVSGEAPLDTSVSVSSVRWKTVSLVVVSSLTHSEPGNWLEVWISGDTSFSAAAISCLCTSFDDIALSDASNPCDIPDFVILGSSASPITVSTGTDILCSCPRSVVCKYPEDPLSPFSVCFSCSMGSCVRYTSTFCCSSAIGWGMVFMKGKLLTGEPRPLGDITESESGMSSVV